jgi:hypothetical protein
MITLYHGSNVRIDDIDLSQCNPYKDFGQAFYLTTEPERAMDVAKARVDIFGGAPIVNIFRFDERLLNDNTLRFKTLNFRNHECKRTGIPIYGREYHLRLDSVVNGS